MLHLDDDDDEDFTIKAGAGSKLANLFGSSETQLDVDKSLVYTPPKQPKKIEMSSNSSSGTSVMTLIHASAVNVFKFENGKYSSQGKLGAALLGNHDSCNYKLILYTGKQQHITYCSVNENFKFICQPNNYCSFYDDNRQNWSIMFDNEEEKCTFNKQLVVCKYNSVEKSGNDSLLLVQDLLLGNEESLVETEDNDIVELKYKGWVYDDRNSVGKLFVNHESMPKKPFRIKLENKWCEVLRGLKIGARRYALFSFKLRQQFSDILENAPKEQVLRYGFEFELIKIRPRKSQKPDKQIDSNEQKPSTVEADKEKTSTKSLPGSVNTPVKDESQPIKSKSDILSRVARMGGLPILPVKSDSSSPKPESSDITDAQHNEEENTQTKPLPKPRNNSLTANTSHSDTSVTDSSNKIPESNANLNTVAANVTQIPVSVATSYQIPSYFMAQNTSIEANLALLANETRANSTEVRMSLNKIIDKIDLISEKVSDIKNSPNSSIPSMPISSIGFMDSAILLSSIQRIVNENNNLKKELDDKTSNLQKLNEKICDLLQQQSNNTMNQNSSSLEMEKLLINESRLKQELQLMTEQCERYRIKYNDLDLENTHLKKTIDQLKSEIQSGSKPRVDDSYLTNTKEFSSQVKKIMNDVFRKFMSQIDENKTYQSEEIIEIVSNSIRSATLAVIESRSNSERSSPFHQPIDEIDVNKVEEKSNELNKSFSQTSRETKKPPIPERSINEAQQKHNENNHSNQSPKESIMVSQESQNIQKSSDSVNDEDSTQNVSIKDMAFDEKSKTWKPKIPSSSPPDFEFVCEDLNEDLK